MILLANAKFVIMKILKYYCSVKVFFPYLDNFEKSQFCPLMHINNFLANSPPAIFSAKSMTICVKLTGPGASESMPWASPSETDFPTPAKAATRSELDKRPSLSASMIPKASLNSWICLWEKRANTLEPLFLAFLKLDNYIFSL